MNWLFGYKNPAHQSIKDENEANDDDNASENAEKAETKPTIKKAESKRSSNPWIRAYMEARDQLEVQGWQTPKRGTKLYKVTREIYDGYKNEDARKNQDEDVSFGTPSDDESSSEDMDIDNVFKNTESKKVKPSYHFVLNLETRGGLFLQIGLLHFNT